MKGIKTKAMVLFLGLSVMGSGAVALADYRADDRGHMEGHRIGIDRHHPHYYHNGRWYRHGWFGFGVAVPVLSAGVYVDTLPPAYTPVVIQGATYYYGDNTYFAPAAQGGYTVVVPPGH